MSHDIGPKLRKLYALATVSPEQEKDEARMNEARNAAYLLLKTARQAGVRLQFVRAAEPAREPVEEPQAGVGRPQDNPWTTPYMRKWYERKWGRGA
jgi:hypothetical protein